MKASIVCVVLGLGLMLFLNVLSILRDKERLIELNNRLSTLETLIQIQALGPEGDV